MGSIITKISKKLIHSPKETKIIIVGLDGAGKTTILYKLKLGEIRTTVPTIGFNVETVKYKNIFFKVWDIGGQEKTRCLWEHYYRDTKGVIFVIDSSDIEHIDNDCNEYNHYNQASCYDNIRSRNNVGYYNEHCARDELQHMLNHPSLNNCPVLILANKQDLSNSMSVKEISERLQLNRVTSRKWYVQSTCAMTGEGLIQGLTWLSKNVNIKNKKNKMK